MDPISPIVGLLGAVGGIAGIVALILVIFKVGKFCGEYSSKINSCDDKVNLVWRVLVENAVSVSRRDRLASNPSIRKRGNELLERLSPDLQRTVRGNPINCSSDEEAAQIITIRHYEEIQNVAKEENLSFFAILGLLMQAWRINTSQRE